MSQPDESHPKPSVQDLVRSLTGFDEIAIEQTFRKEFGDLSATMTMRAIAFVLRRRAGLNDPDAYKAAMNASLGELEAELGPNDVMSSPEG